MSSLAEKYKPYPAYKPSGVEWLEEIPAHWEVKRLKYSAPLRNDKLGNKPEDAAYVGLENIEPWTGELLLDYQPDSVDSTVVTFAPGDVLFGKLRPYLAKVAHPDFEGTATSEVLVMRPLEECSQSYLAYCLLNAPYIRWIDTLTYGAKMPRVSPDEVACSFIPLPPLPEQRAIAAFLDRETARIDVLVARKERLIELLQEKRTALITRAVTRGLDPDAPMKDSGVEWLGEIPAHWDVKRLKDVGEAQIGLTYGPNDVVTHDDGILVLRASNIFGGRIVLEDNVYVQCSIPEKLITEEGDILICSRSGSRSLIGKNAKINCNSSGMTFGAFMTIFRSRHNDYLHYVFNSALFEFQSAMFITSTINQLTLGMLKGFSVPLPPTNEQTSIATFLDQETAKLDSLVAKVHEAIESLRELRSALISAAVTGRIDVREEVGCK